MIVSHAIRGGGVRPPPGPGVDDLSHRARHRRPLYGHRVDGTVSSASIRAAALELFAERGYRATTMADIAGALGIKAPSLYKHVASKQALLADIMLTTMRTLLDAQQTALAGPGDHEERLRRFVGAHVGYHARHRQAAHVGTREIHHLEEPVRTRVVGMRSDYEHALRTLVEQGCAVGAFTTTEPRLASYAILDMGMGLSVWFRADGELSVDQLADSYAEMAVRLLRDAR
jgi:AcrR family transcriptional regulator